MSGAAIFSTWSGRELLDEPGARRLAQELVAFWAERGFAIEARVERFTRGGGFQPVYGVRSDLVNGWPVRRRGGGV